MKSKVAVRFMENGDCWIEIGPTIVQIYSEQIEELARMAVGGPIDVILGTPGIKRRYVDTIEVDGARYTEIYIRQALDKGVLQRKPPC